MGFASPGGFYAAQGTGHGFYPAQGALFTPLSLPGLALWLDASDLGTLWQDSARTTAVAADADPVGAWDDKSGNARHVTQGTASKRPLYKTAIQNGRSVIRYDGVDDFHAIPSLTYGAAWTMFLVCKNAASQYIISGSALGESPAIITGYGGVSFEYYNTAGDRSTLDASATGIHAMAVVWDDAANKTGYFNGTQAFSSATTANHSGDSMTDLGRNSAGAVYYGGDICEVLIYASALSPANVALVFAYLRTKWGTP